MVINNKLDKTFGPIGSFAGVVILLLGIYSCFYSWIGVTTVIVGCFLAFTNTSTQIDFANKRTKFTNNLFGIFKVGYWTEIKPEMRLEVTKTTRSKLAFSQVDDSQTQSVKDFRIMLLNEKNIPIMALKKFDKIDDAKVELIQFAEKLNIIK
ncbi:MAG: hypothetical protein PHE33_00350 [Bacteroidales bacterium]|nr:hypothetical protein [Bacteroidales bacterium]